MKSKFMPKGVIAVKKQASDGEIRKSSKNFSSEN